MSDTLSLVLSPETHKSELLNDTHALSYSGNSMGLLLDAGHSGAAKGQFSDTAQFPGGLRGKAESHLDSMQAQGLAMGQFAVLMATSTLSHTTEVSSAEATKENATVKPSGTALDFLFRMNLASPKEISKLPEAETSLPKMQFISNDNALLTNSRHSATTVADVFTSEDVGQTNKSDMPAADNDLTETHSIESNAISPQQNNIPAHAEDQFSLGAPHSKTYNDTSHRPALSLRGWGMIMNNGTEVPSETINVEGHPSGSAVGAGGGGGGASGGHDGGNGLGNAGHKAGEVYTVRGLRVRNIGNTGYVLADNGKDFATYKSGPDSWSPLTVDLLQQKLTKLRKRQQDLLHLSKLCVTLVTLLKVRTLDLKITTRHLEEP